MLLIIFGRFIYFIYVYLYCCFFNNFIPFLICSIFSFIFKASLPFKRLRFRGLLGKRPGLPVGHLCLSKVSALGAYSLTRSISKTTGEEAWTAFGASLPFKRLRFRGLLAYEEHFKTTG